jgi:hypothetical protein
MIKLRESGHPVARDLVEAVLLLVINGTLFHVTFRL